LNQEKIQTWAAEDAPSRKTKQNQKQKQATAEKQEFIVKMRKKKSGKTGNFLSVGGKTNPYFEGGKKKAKTKGDGRGRKKDRDHSKNQVTENDKKGKKRGPGSPIVGEGSSAVWGGRGNGVRGSVRMEKKMGKKKVPWQKKEYK